MSDRQRLVDLIIRHEGWELFPYQDQYGHWTIGAGRNLSANGISAAEASTLLDHDLEACIHDLTTFPWFVTLDPVRQRVLVDLRYNVGPAGLRTFVKLLRALDAGDYPAAAAALRDSKWYGQVKQRGVTLVQMMQTGVDA